MTPGTPRPRNAAATRQAILASAISAFSQHGYDGIGVREIAADAGVTAMLVNRYFGSKEGLFIEAVDAAFAPPTMVPSDAADLASRTAAALVDRTAPEADHLAPFALVINSVSNPRACEIVRAGIEKHVGARFAAALNGPQPRERAELGLALIAGTWLMRKVVATPALRDADPRLLTAQLTAMFDVVVESDPAT